MECQLERDSIKKEDSIAILMNLCRGRFPPCLLLALDPEIDVQYPSVFDHPWSSSRSTAVQPKRLLSPAIVGQRRDRPSLMVSTGVIPHWSVICLDPIDMAV